MVEKGSFPRLRKLGIAQKPTVADDGGMNPFQPFDRWRFAVVSHIQVTRESAEYFCVRLLDLYGPRAHLDVIISADDLSQWRDRINEALQEVDNVGV